jgi:thioredoxin
MEAKSPISKMAIVGIVFLTLTVTVSLCSLSAGGLPSYKRGNNRHKTVSGPARLPAKSPPRIHKYGGKAMSTDERRKPSVEHASEATFDKQVLRSKVPVLVDFYADWCRPCQMLAPTLDELAKENPNVKIVKVNVDDNPRLAARFGVSSIPNLKVFKNGKVAREHVGMADKRQLQSLLSTLAQRRDESLPHPL